MSDADKKKFMQMAMYQMGNNMQSMMKDREDDDDMRKKMAYFKQNQKGREGIDKQIDMRKGQRTMGRMPAGEGASGSQCFLMSEFDDEGKFKGKMRGDGSDDDDMMGKMAKEGMGMMGDMEDLMKGGMQGPKSMMDKMGGMKGMMDKMGKMNSKDQMAMK